MLEYCFELEHGRGSKAAKKERWRVWVLYRRHEWLQFTTLWFIFEQTSMRTITVRTVSRGRVIVTLKPAESRSVLCLPNSVGQSVAGHRLPVPIVKLRGREYSFTVDSIQIRQPQLCELQLLSFYPFCHRRKSSSLCLWSWQHPKSQRPRGQFLE